MQDKDSSNQRKRSCALPTELHPLLRFSIVYPSAADFQVFSKLIDLVGYQKIFKKILNHQQKFLLVFARFDKL
jgi:hypothetical protein